MIPLSLRSQSLSHSSFVPSVSPFFLFEEQSEQMEDLYGKVISIYEKKNPQLIELIVLARNQSQHKVNLRMGKESAFILVLCKVAYKTFPISWFYAGSAYKISLHKNLKTHLPSPIVKKIIIDSEDYPDTMSLDQVNDFYNNLQKIHPSFKSHLKNLELLLKDISSSDPHLSYFLALCGLYALRRVVRKLHSVKKRVHVPENYLKNKGPIEPLPFIHRIIKTNLNVNEKFETFPMTVNEQPIFAFMMRKMSVLICLKNPFPMTVIDLKNKFFWMKMCYVPDVIPGCATTKENERVFLQMERIVRYNQPPPQVTFKEASYTPLDVFAILGPMIYAIPRFDPYFQRKSVSHCLSQFWRHFLPQRGQRYYIELIFNKLQKSELPFYKALEECSESMLKEKLLQLDETMMKKKEAAFHPLLPHFLNDFQEFGNDTIKNTVKRIQELRNIEPPLPYETLVSRLQDIFISFSNQILEFSKIYKQNTFHNPSFVNSLNEKIEKFLNTNSSASWEDIYAFFSELMQLPFHDYKKNLGYFYELPIPNRETLKINQDGIFTFFLFWVENDLKAFEKYLKKDSNLEELKNTIPSLMQKICKNDALHYFRLFRFSPSFYKDCFPLDPDALFALRPFSCNTQEIYAKRLGDPSLRWKEGDFSYHPILITESPKNCVTWSRIQPPCDIMVEYLLESLMFDEGYAEKRESFLLELLHRAWLKECPKILFNEIYALKTIKHYKKAISAEKSDSHSVLSSVLPRELSTRSVSHDARLIQRKVELPLSYRALINISPETGVTINILTFNKNSLEETLFRENIFLEDPKIAGNLSFQQENLSIFLAPYTDCIALRSLQTFIKTLPPSLWEGERPKYVSHHFIAAYFDELYQIPKTMSGHSQMQSLSQLKSFPVATFFFNTSWHVFHDWKNHFPLAHDFLLANGNIPTLTAIASLLTNKTYASSQSLEAIAQDLSFAYSLFLNTYLSTELFLFKLKVLTSKEGQEKLVKEIPTTIDYYSLGLIKGLSHENFLRDHHDIWQSFGLKLFFYHPLRCTELLTLVNLTCPAGHRENIFFIKQELMQGRLPMGRHFFLYLEKKGLDLLNDFLQKVNSALRDIPPSALNELTKKHFDFLLHGMESSLLIEIRIATLNARGSPSQEILSIGSILEKYPLFRSPWNNEWFKESYSKEINQIINKILKELESRKALKLKDVCVVIKNILLKENLSIQLVYSFIEEIKLKARRRNISLQEEVLRIFRNHAELSLNLFLKKMNLVMEEFIAQYNFPSTFSSIAQEAYHAQAQTDYATAWFHPSHPETMMQREIRWDIIEYVFSEKRTFLLKEVTDHIRVLLKKRNPFNIFDEEFTIQCAHEILDTHKKHKKGEEGSPTSATAASTSSVSEVTTKEAFSSSLSILSPRPKKPPSSHIIVHASSSNPAVSILRDKVTSPSASFSSYPSTDPSSGERKEAL